MSHAKRKAYPPATPSGDRRAKPRAPASPVISWLSAPNRQHHAVEPENRLVAHTLERQWEAVLSAEETLKQTYAQFLAQEPTPLSTEERHAIRRLASDIPAL